MLKTARDEELRLISDLINASTYKCGVADSTYKCGVADGWL